MIADAERNWRQLAGSSHIRNAVEEGEFAEMRTQIENATPDDILRFRPLIKYLAYRPVKELLALESDLNTVIAESRPDAQNKAKSFLMIGPKQELEWYGGLFEVFVKSRMLKANSFSVELDVILPNRKEVDLRILVNGKPVYLECTVLNDSDEDRKQSDVAMKDYLASRPPQAWCVGGPPYDCARFYQKVYDKVAPDLDPSNCQLSTTDPNVLLVGRWRGSAFGREADSPVFTGALNGVIPGLTAGEEDGGEDPWVSLKDFLDRDAKERIGRGELTDSDYRIRRPQLLEATRLLSAIGYFDYCQLFKWCVATNSFPAQQLGEGALDTIRAALSKAPAWDPRWNGPPLTPDEQQKLEKLKADLKAMTHKITRSDGAAPPPDY